MRLVSQIVSYLLEFLLVVIFSLSIASFLSLEFKDKLLSDTIYISDYTQALLLKKEVNFLKENCNYSCEIRKYLEFLERPNILCYNNSLCFFLYNGKVCIENVKKCKVSYSTNSVKIYMKIRNKSVIFAEVLS